MIVYVTIGVDKDDAGPTFSETVECDNEALDTVLFDFNPSSNPKVTRIKALCAALVQEMDDMRGDHTTSEAQIRVIGYAKWQIELAQMAAVKALYAKA